MLRRIAASREIARKPLTASGTSTSEKLRTTQLPKRWSIFFRAECARKTHVALVANDVMHAELARDFGRAVARAVVNDQDFDFVDPIYHTWDIRDRLWQCCFFVEARNLNDQLQKHSRPGSGRNVTLSQR